MRTLLLALVCTGCVTSEIVDPTERGYDDRFTIPDDVAAELSDGRFKLRADAPMLEVRSAVDERYQILRDAPVFEASPPIDPRVQVLADAPMLEAGPVIDPRVRLLTDAPMLEVVLPAFREAYVGVRSEWKGDGYLLARLDGTPMTCFDGQVRAVCRTNAIDWSRARLSEEARLQMQHAMDVGASAPGVIAIAAGHWIPIAPNIKYHPDGVWVLAEAWVAEPGGAPSKGEFVRINDNGIMCVVAPCPHLTEGHLYDDETVDIDELDFAPSNLRPQLVQRVLADTYKPDGVIVAGERYYECMTYGVATGRTVTAAYRRLGVK